jgi:phosphatidylserine decarboxylase
MAHGREGDGPMTDYSEQYLEARYRKHFGYAAGYLPKDRRSVDEFHQRLRNHIEQAKLSGEAPVHIPSVKALGDLILRNGVVRMYVEQMIEQQPADHQAVTGVENLLDTLNLIATTAPSYNPDPNKINAFPMSSLFTYMMMTPAGESIFRNSEFNAAIAAILKAWCEFLDGPKSRYVLTKDEDGWLCQSAYWYNKLYEFVIPDQSAPYWGFASFNDYFHRQVRPEARPVADPDNPKVIVSANDGTVYNIGTNAQPTTDFWLKGQPYSLINMLDGEYVDRFIGGTVFQSFLSGANYHRWRSPIDGIVRLARVVDGLMFSDAESAGVDPTAATYSQGYGASVNTRGLVFIESPDANIGLVCVIPIGITEISSVQINVKEGDNLKKGDELGWFSYGGSGMALVFQPGAIDSFTVPNRPSGNNPDDGPPIRVNAQIALGR